VQEQSQQQQQQQQQQQDASVATTHRFQFMRSLVVTLRAMLAS